MKSDANKLGKIRSSWIYLPLSFHLLSLYNYVLFFTSNTTVFLIYVQNTTISLAAPVSLSSLKVHPLSLPLSSSLSLCVSASPPNKYTIFSYFKNPQSLIQFAPIFTYEVTLSPSLPGLLASKILDVTPQLIIT